MSGLTIVSVVRDYEMYDRCIRSNPFVSGAELVCLDNNAENLGVSTRYNSFIDSLTGEEDLWVVFCHEDWQALESLSELVSQLDKSRIYGPVGVYVQQRLFADYIIYKGSLRQCEKDGSNDAVHSYAVKSGRVDTLDCQCIIVHSSLLTGKELRFDESFDFHMYAEDFCANAYFNHRVYSFAIPIECRHWSAGVMSSSFDAALLHIRHKYASASKRMATVVGHDNVFGCESSRKVMHTRIGRQASLFTFPKL